MRRARLNDICCWVVTENWLRRMTQRESRFREEGLSMRNAAVMAMISLSAIGFAVADGEMRRVRWVQAMRRTLMRINDMIRYERVPLAKLLQSIELHATREQRDLTRLLHACGARLENSVNPQLVEIFAAETERTPGYGVLSQTDRSAFEQVMAELGRTGLDEQLRILSDADERLRQREECLRRDAGRRAQLIRTLGVTGGAALFLRTPAGLGLLVVVGLAALVLPDALRRGRRRGEECAA